VCYIDVGDADVQWMEAHTLCGGARGLLLSLTFMGPFIANIFQYMSNKMQLYTVYLYLENAVPSHPR